MPDDTSVAATTGATTSPVPTDPGYYLNQVGLGSLQPQAFNADTLAAMFAPQSIANTPVNNLATNPFFSLFLQGAQDATKLQHKNVPGLNDQSQNSPSGQGPGQSSPMPSM